MQTNLPQPEDLAHLKTITLIIYGLYALGFFTGITWLIAIIINYVKKEDVQGTMCESHFKWQINTFWFGVLWSVIGTVTLVVGVGFVILGAAYVWGIYRIVKGLIKLNENKAMYSE